jgi:ubiquinone/menaquinone biosynthesis C-methylase UbiE
MDELDRTPEKTAQLERFAKAYKFGQSDVSVAIERRVCGCDYGGTSWSTREECERICQLLQLAPGVHLLEVGAGSGWPGLYLAKVSDCAVTMTDLLPDGLHIAAERAARERAEGDANGRFFAAADSAALPFADRSFDAIVHSDVLCCVEQKAETLRACRRALKDDGRMAFTVILTTPGLAGEDLAQAIAGGPTYIATEIEYPDMVRQTGWEISLIDDITPQYADALANMLREEETHAEALGEVYGDKEIAERLARRRNGLACLSRGLLRREMYVVRPV